MKWWDFSDITFIIFFIISILMGLFLIYVCVSFSISNSTDSKQKALIKKECNTIRIFVIKPKEDYVLFFNKSSIKKKKVMNLNDFYSRFHPNDIKKVKKWIYSICMGTNDDEYIEADVLVNKEKHNFFSLLRILKYDTDTGTLHIESHILKYMTPNNAVVNKHRGIEYGIVDQLTMTSIIENQKNIGGFCFAIRFFCLKAMVNTSEKVERYMTMSLKNSIYTYAKSKNHFRQILDNDPYQMFLFDLNITTKEAAIALANSLDKDIKKAIGLHSVGDIFSFAIGISDVSLFFHDFHLLIENAEQACIEAQQNGSTIYLASKKVISKHNNVAKYDKQIASILKSNSIRYLFRPILDSQNGKVIGYFEFLKAYDSPFAGFYELHKFASRNSKNKDVFTMVAKATINKYLSEVSSNGPSLFLSSSLLDIDFIDEIITQIRGNKTANLTLTFNEIEISENSSENYNFVNEKLSMLRKNGYPLALLLNNVDLLLDPSIYVNFDYFIVGDVLMDEVKKSQRSRVTIHTLIEQLLKYNKPIIATNLNSWQEIELIIKCGISLVSSEIIAGSNDMLLPIDKRKSDRLKLLFNKYN